MKTILVPTDFSAESKNACIYAFNLASDLQVEKLILYHSFMSPTVMMDEPSAMPVIPVIDIEEYRKIGIENLKTFAQSFQGSYPENLIIEQISELGDLATDIDEVCETTGAELVVLGLAGTNNFEEVWIGSSAVSVFKHTKVPVIIVPLEAVFSSVNNVMLASDFKKVAATTPAHSIKSILKATNATLHILNVYEEVNEVSADKAYQKDLLQSLFKEYEPQFHFIKNEDFIAGINDFVKANKIDLIIAIPKKHGFLHNVFKEGHVKKLAFHSQIPSMYVHEEDL